MQVGQERPEWTLKKTNPVCICLRWVVTCLFHPIDSRLSGDLQGHPSGGPSRTYPSGPDPLRTRLPGFWPDSYPRNCLFGSKAGPNWRCSEGVWARGVGAPGVWPCRSPESLDYRSLRQSRDERRVSNSRPMRCSSIRAGSWCESDFHDPVLDVWIQFKGGYLAILSMRPHR